VPVVRLDDAGMSVQMAEYVCHAVIRHFRELDAMRPTLPRANGLTASRACATDFPVGVMGLGVLGERVSQALAQFDFPVNGWSRSPKAIEGVQCFSGRARRASRISWRPAASWSACCR
jgi:glyoxylate/hydroxypyruvate reductase A